MKLIIKKSKDKELYFLFIENVKGYRSSYSFPEIIEMAFQTINRGNTFAIWNDIIYEHNHHYNIAIDSEIILTLDGRSSLDKIKKDYIEYFI